MRLIHVFDAHCGWSHGSPRGLLGVVARHPGLPVEVVSGGLFTGPRRVPIRAFGHVHGTNASIAELTGATFGEAYEKLIADGSFVRDSEADARGVAALRRAAPECAAELAAALQHAFHVEGRRLPEAATPPPTRPPANPVTSASPTTSSSAAASSSASNSSSTPPSSATP